jgi:hypothetical protein
VFGQGQLQVVAQAELLSPLFAALTFQEGHRMVE